MASIDIAMARRHLFKQHEIFIASAEHPLDLVRIPFAKLAQKLFTAMGSPTSQRHASAPAG